MNPRKPIPPKGPGDTQEIPFEDIRRALNRGILPIEDTTPNLVVSIIENQKNQSIPESVAVHSKKGETTHQIKENSHLQTIIEKAIEIKNSDGTKMITKRRLARILCPTPDATDFDLCKQTFRDHQGIAFSVLEENFSGRVNHGQYDEYNISNIFRELLFAYKNFGNLSSGYPENKELEQQVIDICNKNKDAPINSTTGAFVRGFKNDSIAFREVPIHMNVSICPGLISDLDALVREFSLKHAINSYYEIGRTETLSNPLKQLISVKYFFYSRGNETDKERKKEDQILHKVGAIANRYSRGLIMFGDSINNSNSAAAFLTPMEFTEDEMNNFLQIIQKIGGLPLFGAVRSFLSTEVTKMTGTLSSSGISTKFNRESFYILKRTFEDFGIDIVYKKDKGFVFYPISQ